MYASQVPKLNILTNAVTSEILFELYQPPSVTYGIDSLFEFNTQQKKDGLAINMGNTSTTLIPVLNGRGDLSRAKRYVIIRGKRKC
jgi:actin-related protein 5